MFNVFDYPETADGHHGLRSHRLGDQLVLLDEDLRKGWCAGRIARLGAGVQPDGVLETRRSQPVARARVDRGVDPSGERRCTRKPRVSCHPHHLADGCVACGAQAAEGPRLDGALLLPLDRLVRHQRAGLLTLDPERAACAVGGQRAPGRSDRMAGRPGAAVCPRGFADRLSVPACGVSASSASRGLPAAGGLWAAARAVRSSRRLLAPSGAVRSARAVRSSRRLLAAARTTCGRPEGLIRRPSRGHRTSVDV